MPTIEIKSEQLLKAALQLPRAELEQFVAKLFSLRTKQDTPNLSQAESALLLNINQSISPTTQQRLDELVVKRQGHLLTAKEQQELIQITGQIEKFDAERLKHLIELAHLRDVPLTEIIEQLGIRPSPHD